MLDLKQVRENTAQIEAALKRRDNKLTVNALLGVDRIVRSLQRERDDLSQEINEIAASFPTAKGDESVSLRARSRQLRAMRDQIAAATAEVEKARELLLSSIPNVPDATVPDGTDETGNVVVKTWGEVPELKEPKSHEELGRALGMLDFERGVKVAASRFTVLMNYGAKLERALMNFMLDQHGLTGYVEVFPPILVNRTSLEGTGQLPKFAGDLYRCADDELFLVPTAEVPVTNLYRDEVLDAATLPLKHCAYTPNFRREAGSAGKDTRGYIRQHQFNKVELVKFAHPDTSAEEHEKLTADAERILEMLKLPYRRVLLCAGDMGFSAQKCYDLEVWFPAQGTYREISSCSNFGEFQARRANLKFRPADGGKPRYLHTLNGSGLAIGRTLAAILENYQNADGTVRIPDVLVPYLGGVTSITGK